jgi:hypothetical protein
MPGSLTVWLSARSKSNGGSTRLCTMSGVKAFLGKSMRRNRVFEIEAPERMERKGGYISGSAVNKKGERGMITYNKLKVKSPRILAFNSISTSKFASTVNFSPSVWSSDFFDSPPNGLYGM